MSISQPNPSHPFTAIAMKPVLLLLLSSVAQPLLAQDPDELAKLRSVLGEDAFSLLLKAKRGESSTRPSDSDFEAWAASSKILSWKPLQANRADTRARFAMRDAMNRAIRESDANDSAANAPGSLSAVGRSSLANALGITIGSGGLAQSTQKTTGTISSNLYVLLCGTLSKSLIDKRPAAEADFDLCQPTANPLKNLTFSITLKDQEDQTTLRRPLEGIGAAQVRWDIFNKRDLRAHLNNKKHEEVFKFHRSYQSLVKARFTPTEQCAKAAANSLKTAYGENGFDSEDSLLAAFKTIRESYQSCAGLNLDKSFIRDNSFTTFENDLRLLREDAKKTWVLAATYDFVRQSLPNASPAKTASAAPAPTTPAPTELPSLSTFGITWESGQYGRFKYSGSFNATLFNNAPAASGDGFRDYRIASDFDFQLIENKDSKLNGMKFTLSGMFLDLRREPLGKKVTLFDKVVTSPGRMGVVVGKITIPGPNETSKIPISLSYATRSELLPDKEWRAGIGYTFNWRQLFQ